MVVLNLGYGIDDLIIRSHYSLQAAPWNFACAAGSFCFFLAYLASEVNTSKTIQLMVANPEDVDKVVDIIHQVTGTKNSSGSNGDSTN